MDQYDLERLAGRTSRRITVRGHLIDRFANASRALVLVRDAVRELGDDFAGVWNADSPTVYSRGHTNPVSQVDNIAVSEVAYSKAQLEAAKAVLDMRAAEIVDGGLLLPLAGWWIDIPNNALKVQVVNPISVDAIRNDLARYVGHTTLELEVVPGRMIQESRLVDPADAVEPGDAVVNR